MSRITLQHRDHTSYNTATTAIKGLIAMGKMKFLSESIPVSSAILWKRFRIVGSESVSKIGIGSGIGSKSKSALESELSPKLESVSKRSQIRHRHNNRRLGRWASTLCDDWMTCGECCDTLELSKR